MHVVPAGPGWSSVRPPEGPLTPPEDEVEDTPLPSSSCGVTCGPYRRSSPVPPIRGVDPVGEGADALEGRFGRRGATLLPMHRDVREEEDVFLTT